eukprot:363107-Chlamydomonas_euryale.AAC.11
MPDKRQPSAGQLKPDLVAAPQTDAISLRRFFMRLWHTLQHPGCASQRFTVNYMHGSHICGTTSASEEPSEGFHILVKASYSQQELQGVDLMSMAAIPVFQTAAFLQSRNTCSPG